MMSIINWLCCFFEQLFLQNSSKSISSSKLSDPPATRHDIFCMLVGLGVGHDHHPSTADRQIDHECHPDLIAEECYEDY